MNIRNPCFTYRQWCTFPTMFLQSCKHWISKLVSDTYFINICSICWNKTGEADTASNIGSFWFATDKFQSITIKIRTNYTVLVNSYVAVILIYDYFLRATVYLILLPSILMLFETSLPILSSIWFSNTARKRVGNLKYSLVRQVETTSL